MKNLIIRLLPLIATCLGVCHAQEPSLSEQAFDFLLTDTQHRAELTRIKTAISTALDDQRLTDQAARLMLGQSQTVLSELLDQKLAENADKLVDLAVWMRSQSIEGNAIEEIEDAGGELEPEEQFVLDNPLAGQEIYLLYLIDTILIWYELEGMEDTPHRYLEASLQLYFHFRDTLEGGDGIPNGLLTFAPEWLQERYPKLSVEQKQRFLKDVQDSRELTLEPNPDSEPGPPFTAEQDAAYEAGYQYILNNTPSLP